MRFKLLIVMAETSRTDKILDTAREAGATGSTVIGDARGEGLNPRKTFFGMKLETQREMVLLLVEEHLSRKILERIGEVAEFEANPGSGVAFQIDVEDVIGLRGQIERLMDEVEDKI